MTKAEQLYNEKKAHLQTKLALYQAQSAVLQAAFQNAQAELAALVRSGEEPMPDPKADPPAEAEPPKPTDS